MGYRKAQPLAAAAAGIRLQVPLLGAERRGMGVAVRQQSSCFTAGSKHSEPNDNMQSLRHKLTSQPPLPPSIRR